MKIISIKIKNLRVKNKDIALKRNQLQKELNKLNVEIANNRRKIDRIKWFLLYPFTPFSMRNKFPFKDGYRRSMFSKKVSIHLKNHLKNRKYY